MRPGTPPSWREKDGHLFDHEPVVFFDFMQVRRHAHHTAQSYNTPEVSTLEISDNWSTCSAAQRWHECVNLWPGKFSTCCTTFVAPPNHLLVSFHIEIAGLNELLPDAHICNHRVAFGLLVESRQAVRFALHHWTTRLGRLSRSKE